MDIMVDKEILGFFNNIEKRLEYLKSQKIPVCLICQGDYGSSLALMIMDQYYNSKDFRVYATTLPCFSGEHKRTMQKILGSLNNIEIRYIDCGDDCIPLGSDRNPVGIHEYPYYGACTVIQSTMVSDYWPGSFINIISGAYSFPEIEPCYQYNHLKLDAYGLGPVHPGNEVIPSPTPNRSFYLFYGLNQEQIRSLAQEVGFYLEPARCWDEIDKKVLEKLRATYPGCSNDALATAYEHIKQLRRDRTAKLRSATLPIPIHPLKEGDAIQIKGVG